jgi:glutaredoxin
MDKKYVLFVKPGCPFCVDAVMALSEREKEYSVVKVDGDSSELVIEMKEATGWPTFPMVFMRDLSLVEGQDCLVRIGGYTDLMKHLESEDE